MKFGSYFKAPNLPKPPLVMGRPWLVQSWGMLGNDRQADCFWAGAAHETMMLWADAGSGIPMFSTQSVLKDYHAAAGPHDGGTDLQDGCSYRQRIGISDLLGHQHRIDIYTSLKVGDLSELDLTVYLFGVAGIGVLIPSNTETQFNYGEPFSVDFDSDITESHYIPIIGRNSHGDYLGVTWGRLTAITPEWIEEYMTQGVAIVSRERLNAQGLSPQGYNEAQLIDDFKQLTET